MTASHVQHADQPLMQPTQAARTAPRLWHAIATSALVIALLCAIAELLAGPGYRMGWWPFPTGLMTIRWAGSIAIGAAVVALLALLLGGRSGARKRALLGLLVALTAALPPGWFWLKLQKLPRIHDISTDTAEPPRFVAAVPLRAGARNPVDWDPAVAALQRSGYPDIAPIEVAEPPARALERAEQVAIGMGWSVIGVDRSALTLEATATSVLFGFRDDIVVRVRPHATGSRIDVRSLSRVGGHDFGANAGRVREFAKRVRSAP